MWLEYSDIAKRRVVTEIMTLCFFFAVHGFRAKASNCVHNYPKRRKEDWKWKIRMLQTKHQQKRIRRSCG